MMCMGQTLYSTIGGTGTWLAFFGGTALILMPHFQGGIYAKLGRMDFFYVAPRAETRGSLAAHFLQFLLRCKALRIWWSI
jgi:hypothetical protein